MLHTFLKARSQGLEIIQYMAYQTHGSNIFFAEGFPMDITDPKTPKPLLGAKKFKSLGI